jgi:hypothetical protein
MRFMVKVFFVLLILGVTPAAFAQLDGGTDGVDSVAGISDGCGATMNPDDCMFQDSGWSSTICTSSACPACAFDATMTKSICYYLTGNSGYCKCSGGGVTKDKYGNVIPNCSASGSCVASRR